MLESLALSNSSFYVEFSLPSENVFNNKADGTCGMPFNLCKIVVHPNYALNYTLNYTLYYTLNFCSRLAVKEIRTD
jgi:hypothetical protein